MDKEIYSITDKLNTCLELVSHVFDKSRTMLDLSFETIKETQTHFKMNLRTCYNNECKIQSCTACV